MIGKIIDFEIRGNTVRFYLGDVDDKEYHGDDWNDTPYEHNAGQVYDEYIKGIRTIYFDYDWLVLEPCDGELNSRYCKDDLKNKEVPCVLVVKNKEKYMQDDLFDSYKFDYWLEKLEKDEVFRMSEDVEPYYFNDLLMSGESYDTTVSGLFFSTDAD